MCGKWFHKLGPPITKEHFVCVDARERTLACMRVSLHACVCLCVFACMCVCDCVCVCLYTCARVRFVFVIRKYALRSVSLNNKVVFL